MSVFSANLFLGFCVTASYAEALTKIAPQMLQLFISENEESHLKEVTFEKVRYFGKFVGEITTLQELHLLEKNIYSILNKIVPNQSCEDVPLVLFAAPSSTI